MSYDTLPELNSLSSKDLTSHPEFGSGTKGSDVAQAFAEHIKDKNVVITASRTPSKLEDVAKLVKETTGFDAAIIELDLSSQVSIRKAASEVQKHISHIDILINNAAVVSSDRRETKDGLELTFGTNHVGHWLWTSLLTPLMLPKDSNSCRPARIVNVTSLGYRLSPFRFHDYNFEGKQVPPEEEPPNGLPPHMKPNMAENRPYQGFCAYGQSKTANILHCVSLNERYGPKGLRAFAVHPGSIWTDLSRNLTPEDLKIIEGTSTIWLSLDQGIATILVAALDPKLAEAKSEVLLSDCKFEEVADSAKDAMIAERLWKLTENLTGSSSKI